MLDINFLEKNNKGETLRIFLTKCENSGGKHALPILWFANGYTDRVLETYWHLETFVRDDKGCWGIYNPQHKIHPSGGRYVINFDWMFEATEENKEKLIKEVYRRFAEAKI